MYWQSFFCNCVSWTRQWGWNPFWIRVCVTLTQFLAKPCRLIQNSEHWPLVCFAAIWNVWPNGLRFFSLLLPAWFCAALQSFPCGNATWQRRRKGSVVPRCVVTSKYNSLGCKEEATAWLTARATTKLLCFQKLYVDRAKQTWKSTGHSYMLSSESILSETRLTANRAPVASCEKGWRTLTY